MAMYTTQLLKQTTLFQFLSECLNDFVQIGGQRLTIHGLVKVGYRKTKFVNNYRKIIR